MRYAIFSDIHSNLEAFEGVLSAYEKEGIDKYLCVGDIVGYGANPKECIQIIRDKKITTVAGNHDWASSGRFDVTYFNPRAREAVHWTRKQLNTSEIDYINNLDLIYKEEGFCLVHGTLIKPERFEYLFELTDTKAAFEAMQSDLCFIGHTHSPVIFSKDGEEITYGKENNINIEPNKQYIINVGSVGQPRDGDSRCCYCIYDSDNKLFQIKRIKYDIESAQKKILDAGLPSTFANRLIVGL
ncbi:metallophosphoesterase family protein [Candidatus Omnitrophota bacterium]